jgi:hypothetical protein
MIGMIQSCIVSEKPNMDFFPTQRMISKE